MEIVNGKKYYNLKEAVKLSNYTYETLRQYFFRRGSERFGVERLVITKRVERKLISEENLNKLIKRKRARK